ncbi:MAG: hypothetical protein ACYCVB_06650 [Bacilli bacterium]
MTTATLDTYTISAPALAGLLKPYRGLPKSHGVIRRRVDELGKIHARTIRYALPSRTADTRPMCL